MTDLASLVARLSFGGLMLIMHGWPKLMGGSPSQFPDPLGVGPETSYWLAVFSEVICSALVMLGLFTRLSASFVLITMTVAFGIVHAADPFAKKELALLYGLGFLVIFLLGGGRYSVQNLLRLGSTRAGLRFLLK